MRSWLWVAHALNAWNTTHKVKRTILHAPRTSHGISSKQTCRACALRWPSHRYSVGWIFNTIIRLFVCHHSPACVEHHGSKNFTTWARTYANRCSTHYLQQAKHCIEYQCKSCNMLYVEICNQKHRYWRDNVQSRHVRNPWINTHPSEIISNMFFFVEMPCNTNLLSKM